MKSSNKKLSLLFASRLVEEKGIKDVLETIRFLKETDGDFFETIEWHFCSDGDYRERVEQLTKEYPNVHYHGIVSRESLAELYRQSDTLLMPSVFLETFGLTALEANGCGTIVIGPKKGGLIDFIDDAYAIDENNVVESIVSSIKRIAGENETKGVNIEKYRREKWEKTLGELFGESKKILIIHDYKDRIGGAEVYVESLEKPLKEGGRDVSYGRYEGKTSPLRRKLLFIGAIFGYFRQRTLAKELEKFRPDAIWMHSVLRYHGVWSIRQIMKYSEKYRDTKIYLSHHDIGLIAPFPQDVTSEGEIPKDTSLREFLKGLTPKKKIVATIKWLYVLWLKKYLPKNTEHIIFSPFLEKHIYHHFGEQKTNIFPHTFDETIFHP